MATEQRPPAQNAPDLPGPPGLIELPPIAPRLAHLESQEFEELVVELLQRRMRLTMDVDDASGELAGMVSDTLRPRLGLWIKRTGSLSVERIEGIRRAVKASSSKLGGLNVVIGGREKGQAELRRVMGSGLYFSLRGSEWLLEQLDLPANADLAARFLRPSGPVRDGTPAYSSDAVARDPEELIDDLGRKREIDVLARLLVSREVDPPLSVGLLGDWGTGKSTFMGLLEGEIRALSAAAASQPEDRQTCRRVAHVRFNAWHYSDTHLWASLVGHLFTCLAEEMTPRDAAPEVRRELLEKSIEAEEGVLAQERERVAGARQVVLDLKARTAAGRRLTMIDEVLGDAGRREELVKRGEAIGWGRALEDALQTREALRVVEEQRWRFLFNVISRNWWRPLGLFTLGTIVVFGAAVASAVQTWWTVPPLLQAWGLALAQLVVTVGVAFDALQRASRPLDRFVKTARAALSDMDAQIAQDDTVEADTVAELEGWLAEQEAQLALKEQQLAQLQDARAALDPTEDLRRFLFDRARSPDYRDRRGLVTLVREDLEALSRRMRAYREAFHAHGDAAKAREAARLPVVDGQQLDPVERIVLYVDDLDRCEPTQVVEVLQAIHMLLSFDLFVVIVAVDPRWLLGSLRVVYRELFRVDDPGADDVTTIARTTPVAYLEKIFQVPIALQPMEAGGYARLVDTLVARRFGASVVPELGPDGALPPVETPVAEASEARTSGEGTASEEAGDTTPVPARPGGTIPADLDTRRVLRIDPHEHELIVRLHPFVPSPRAAKRLINVYRIVRTVYGLLDSERDGVLASREALLILLAVGVGFPAAWADLRAGLERMDSDEAERLGLAHLASLPRPDSELPRLPAEVKEAEEAWQELQGAVRQLLGPPPRELELDEALELGLRVSDLRRWLPVAARFSFRAATG